MPLTITSLRGGLNNTDAPTSLADDQCTIATNVEFFRSPLGERRRGAAGIDLSGSDLATCNEIVWVHRHLPTSDPVDAQLWALGITYHVGVTLAYKDTAWHTVTLSDEFADEDVDPYKLRGVSLHGKLFLFYKSIEAFTGTPVDRLHVWDGTSVRRVGLAELSTAPTATDTAVAGTFGTVRYYRTREIVQSGGDTVLRSEPSDALTFTPNGAFDGAIVTKPATVNSNATHWELEASLDADNFYVIATTVIGTPTATDTQDAATGYAQDFELSEPIGDYRPPHSAKFGIADDDRLLIVGSHEDEDLDSSVSWTPPANAPGVGNDERIPLDPSGDGRGISTFNLDGFNGGAISEVAAAVSGEIWTFKQEHSYKITRTRQAAKAYEPVTMSKVRGAVRGAVCECVDPYGNPALFFADLSIGPHLITRGGIKQCGQDIFETWRNATIKTSATDITTHAIYYPAANQVQFWFGVGNDDDEPYKRAILQINEMVETPSGWRRGWSLCDGPSAKAFAVCLYSSNIDDNGDRNLTLVPFVGTSVTLDATILRLDTGDDDDGTAYVAQIRTKPLAPSELQTDFEIKSATLIAKAVDGATLSISAVPNGGISTSQIAEDIDCTPADDEIFVKRFMDDLGIAEMSTVQIDFSDTATAGSRWELAKFSMTVSAGQGN